MPYLSDFIIRQISDELFMLENDLVYEDTAFSKDKGIRIRVPKGFVTDGPSVPRAPIVYLLCANRGKRAGVVHDYLYRNKLLTREEEDKIFYDALCESPGVSKITAWLMWKAVRIFGKKHRDASRPNCLNTYQKCDGACSECPFKDSSPYDNIEFIDKKK